jgi:uncharacterized protein YkwD
VVAALACLAAGTAAGDGPKRPAAPSTESTATPAPPLAGQLFAAPPPSPTSTPSPTTSSATPTVSKRRQADPTRTHRAAVPAVHSPSPKPRAAAGSSRRPAPTTSRASKPHTGHTTAHPTAVKTTPRPSKSSGYSQSSIAYSVLEQLNTQRHKVGAKPLRMNSQLITSAHRHNLAMAAANQMSHQLPGEASFGQRITAAGYAWRYAGENIGYNSQLTTSGALALGTMMFNEGPGGGHYENIVNRHYVDVGIDVYIDTVHHVLWLTEDFGSR